MAEELLPIFHGGRCLGIVVESLQELLPLLENAVSVAGTLLLTEATLTDLPEPKEETAGRAEAA